MKFRLYFCVVDSFQTKRSGQQRELSLHTYERRTAPGNIHVANSLEGRRRSSVKSGPGHSQRSVRCNTGVAEINQWCGCLFMPSVTSVYTNKELGGPCQWRETNERSLKVVEYKLSKEQNSWDFFLSFSCPPGR